MIVYNSCLSYSRVISGTSSLSMSLLLSLVSGSSILGVYGLSLNTGDWKMLLLGVLDGSIVSVSLFGYSSRTKANVPPPFIISRSWLIESTLIELTVVKDN